MHLRKATTLLAYLCLGNSFFSSGQCYLPAPALSQRMTDAASIVEGQVIDQRSFWDAAGKVIYTAHTVAVHHWYKNQGQQETIEIITPGGQVDNRLLKVSGSLELQTGDYGIFIAGKNKIAAAHSRTGSTSYFAHQGIYSFLPVNTFTQSATDDGKRISLPAFTQLARQVTGQTKKSIRKTEAAEIQQTILSTLGSFTPASVSAGTGTTITISGTGFGNTPGTVFFRNSNSGGSSFVGTAASQIVSWDDNTIVAVVPSGAGSGTFFIRDAAAVNSPLSATPLTVTYNITNVGAGLRTYLIDDTGDGDGGYRFSFSNNTANNGVSIIDNAGARLRIAEAAARWASSVSYPIYAQGCSAPTTLQTPGQDGINIISFDSDAWDLDVQSSSSTLAVAYSYYLRCGPSNWELTDMDIIFRRDGNPNGIGGSVNWNFSDAAPGAGQIDFMSVAVHEIGHTLQIGHIINAGAVMHYAIAAGTTSRTLSATSDIAAGTDVMNASLAYAPPVISCGAGNDFNVSRQAANYMAAADCGILAIQLLSFQAKAGMDDASLQWEASGHTGDRFVLQRSVNGIDFINIVTRDATNGIATYQWTDRPLLPGSYYYRLALYNNDGSRQFSSIEKIQINAIKKNWIITQTGSQVQIYLPYASSSKPVEVRLHQSNGQLLKRVQVIPGSTTSLDAGELAAGTYFLQAVMNNQPVTAKVIITR